MCKSNKSRALKGSYNKRGEQSEKTSLRIVSPPRTRSTARIRDMQLRQVGGS
jgi:hypothetical protein